MASILLIVVEGLDLTPTQLYRPAVSKIIPNDSPCVWARLVGSEVFPFISCSARALATALLWSISPLQPSNIKQFVPELSYRWRKLSIQDQLSVTGAPEVSGHFQQQTDTNSSCKLHI